MPPPPPPPPALQTPELTPDSEVYRTPIFASSLTAYSLHPHIDTVRISGSKDADDMLLARTWQGKGYIQVPDWAYLSDIQVHGPYIRNAWYDQEQVISLAVWHLHLCRWRSKYGYTRGREIAALPLRVERLKKLIEICKIANRRVSDVAIDLLSQTTRTYRQPLLNTLEKCRAIERSGEEVSIGFRDGAGQRYGIFLYDPSHPLILRREEEQTGLFADDWRPSGYSLKAVQAGLWMNEGLEVAKRTGGQEETTLEIRKKPFEGGMEETTKEEAGVTQGGDGEETYEQVLFPVRYDGH